MAYALQTFDAEKMRTADYRTKGFVSLQESKAPYGPRMYSEAATIEFAYDDFCTARVARRLGKMDDCTKHLKRSQNWQNVWNPLIQENVHKGFPQSRQQDGSFPQAKHKNGSLATINP